MAIKNDVTKKKIGIVGGGQLGKMMILEAKRLGFYVVTLDPSANCPSQSISDELIVSPLNNAQAYFELAEKVDIITYEWELIDSQVLELLNQKGHRIYPSVASLKIIQNKFTQNQTLKNNNIPTPRFDEVTDVHMIKKFGAKENYGFPLILKTTFGGYDGKGVAFIRDESEVQQAFESLGNGKIGLMVEEFIDFELEISVIATRGIDGSRVIYPIAENSHKNSILDTTIAPARISEKTKDNAIKIALDVMEVFEGVGTFGIEMFVTKAGDILVNEIAPRPHNSGHYTIEACFANQFENHIRAITGLPLGSADLISPAVMINLLGDTTGEAVFTGIEEAYANPYVHVHNYGKSTVSVGRKMGHLTAIGTSVQQALERALDAQKIVKVLGKK